MDDAEFDRAAVQAVFEQAALRGWAEVSLVEAAQDAGLDLARMRARFPGRATVLMRFGVQADERALAGAATVGSPRERLFDILMNRFEALQAHRAGVLALLASLPTDPGTAILLYAATLNSMKWLLEAASIPAVGITGMLRVHGLLALWLFALRAWEKDESVDLSATMRAVDQGLDRALQAERSLPGRAPDPPPAEPPPPSDDLPDTSPSIV